MPPSALLLTVARPKQLTEAFVFLAPTLRGPLSRLPLLTVFGSRNNPFELGQKWKQLFPDAEQHTIAGNHYPMGDDPAGVSSLIRRWHSAPVLRAPQPERSAHESR